MEDWDIDTPKGCLLYVGFSLLMMVVFFTGRGIYNEYINIASQLSKHLNNWVWENGKEYKNAGGLKIISITTDMATQNETYECNFITLVKDHNGEFNNYVEGSATIVKFRKKYRKYNNGNKFWVANCTWQGVAKPIYLYNSEERMLWDGLY